VSATTKSLMEKFHGKLFSIQNSLESFEEELIQLVAQKLPAKDALIFSSQLERLNSVYREFDEEKNELSVYFHWKYFGRNRLDYPMKWEENKKEKLLAKISVTYNEKQHIEASFFVVLGVFFFIKFASNTENFTPPSPNYEVDSLEIFEV
jgi:hypothetical protein